MKTRVLDDLRVGPRYIDLKVSKDKTRRIWVRRPNTTQKKMCETGGRQASRALRKLLLDPKTQEHKTLVLGEIDSYTIEDLRMVWASSELVQRLFTFERQTLEDRDQTFVPEPESEDGIHFPGQEVFDHYEDAVETAEAEREAAVESKQTALATQLIEEAKAKTRKQLEKVAKPKIIDSLCGQAYNDEYTTALLAYCTFEDEKCTRPMFKTFDEVRDLFRDRFDIAQQIGNAHSELMIDPEELKN